MKKHTHAHVNVALAALLLAGVSEAQAGGQERSWTCPGGGIFTDAGCWLDGLPPGSDDTAVFDLGGLYTVSYPALAENDRLIVRSGQVALDLGAGAYTLLNTQAPTPAIVIGDGPGVSASLTVLGGGLSGRFVSVGRLPGSLGLLDLLPSGGGDAPGLLAQTRLQVGVQGVGLLDADPGVTLCTAETVIGLGAGSVGQVALRGAALDADLDIVVGSGGHGTLLAEDGTTLVSNEGVIGQQLGGYGAMTLRGATTSWAIAGGLDVGLQGRGVLRIELGATVTTGAFTVLGTAATQLPQNGGIPSEGEIFVAGDGSLLDVGGDLWLGLGGDALLTLDGGGHATVNGTVYANGFQTHRIVVRLDSTDVYQSTGAIHATAAENNIGFRVELAGGFDPPAVAQWRLTSGNFDVSAVGPLDLPALPPGQAWSVTDTPDGVVIAIISTTPVPGDASGDGVVGVNDLVIVILSWGPCNGPPIPCPGDVNGDGEVGVDDLTMVFENWS